MEGNLKFINLREFNIMFLSSYENKIDKKGRVSVPATFLDLTLAQWDTMVSLPIHLLITRHLEACSKIELKNYQILLIFNPFEEKRDYFATSILSESENLQFDTEGRVFLSKNY